MNPYDAPKSNVDLSDETEVEIEDMPEFGFFQSWLYLSIFTALKTAGILLLGLLWFFAGVRAFWVTTVGVPLALALIIVIWLKWPDGYIKRRHDHLREAYLREKGRRAREDAQHDG